MDGSIVFASWHQRDPHLVHSNWHPRCTASYWVTLTIPTDRHVWACPVLAPFCPQNWPCTCGGLDPHLIIYGPPDSTTHMTFQSVSSLLHSSQQRDSMVYDGLLLLPQNCPFTRVALDLHLIHGFLGPPESTSRMSSWLARPFLLSSWLWQTDRQPKRPCYSVCNNRLHLLTTTMRPNNV